MPVSVLADGFVGSPHTKPDVVIVVDDGEEAKEPEESKVIEKEVLDNGQSIEVVVRDDGCHDRIVVTPYADRKLIKNVKSYNQLLEAYEQIEKADVLTKLDPFIEEVAKQKGALVEDLVVRNLFDITIYSDQQETHDDLLHNTYAQIELETDTLDNFVCLMMFKDGKWLIVKDAFVDPNNPSVLSVPVITDSASYAIVVANKYDYIPDDVVIPEGNGCYIHWIILFMASLTALLFALLLIDQTNKEREDIETNHENHEALNRLIRLFKILKIVLLIVDFIICTISFIFFRNCEFDIYVLILNYLACVLILLKIKKDKNEKKDTQEPKA